MLLVETVGQALAYQYYIRRARYVYRWYAPQTLPGPVWTQLMKQFTISLLQLVLRITCTRNTVSFLISEVHTSRTAIHHKRCCGSHHSSMPMSGVLADGLKIKTFSWLMLCQENTPSDYRHSSVDTDKETSVFEAHYKCLTCVSLSIINYWKLTLPCLDKTPCIQKAVLQERFFFCKKNFLRCILGNR